MQDTIQQGLQALAVGNGAARAAMIVCAAAVIYLLGIAWLVVVARRRATLTAAIVVHVALLVVVAYLTSKALGTLIVDPRPYIVAHTRPLIPTAHDNGFPSDHTLLAALLTLSLWWIDRRLVLAFACGTLLVLLGRLGIGAHHTLDVVGSVLIAALGALVSRVVPVPATWDRPFLPALRRAGDALWRPIARRDPLA